jgi:hypothetical protein
MRSQFLQWWTLRSSMFCHLETQQSPWCISSSRAEDEMRYTSQCKQAESKRAKFFPLFYSGLRTLDHVHSHWEGPSGLLSPPIQVKNSHRHIPKLQLTWCLQLFPVAITKYLRPGNIYKLKFIWFIVLEAWKSKSVAPTAGKDFLLHHNRGRASGGETEHVS